MKTGSFLGLALAVLLTGCSAYHAARSSLPADGRERVTLRLRDAQDAERAALESVEVWIQQPEPGMGVGADRVEMRSRELERRVLAARDAAASTSVSETDLREIDRLGRRAEDLLEAVRNARTGEEGKARGSLEGLLKSEAQKESRGTNAAANKRT
jgi:hypothetical protein